MRAYSTDLKERLAQAVAEGQPIREAARRVGVAVTTVKRAVATLHGSSRMTPGSVASASTRSASRNVASCARSSFGGPTTSAFGFPVKKTRGARANCAGLRSAASDTVGMPWPSNSRATNPTDWWQIGQTGTSSTASGRSRAMLAASCGANVSITIAQSG